MKYFTSDLHLGHKNVINYCNRPYASVEEMNEQVIFNINCKVGEKDELYILGDMSLNPKWVEWALPQLLCKNVYLIMGNHDSCFPNKLGNKKKRTDKMKARYFKAGFKLIVESLNVVLSKRRTGLLGTMNFKKKYEVELCHFPFRPEEKPGSLGSQDRRYLDQRPDDEGQILLHGHSHCVYLKNGRQIDVGFDHKFEPWSEEELIALIEDKRDYIPSRITEFYKTRKESVENRENL